MVLRGFLVVRLNFGGAHESTVSNVFIVHSVIAVVLMFFVRSKFKKIVFSQVFSAKGVFS